MRCSGVLIPCAILAFGMEALASPSNNTEASSAAKNEVSGHAADSPTEQAILHAHEGREKFNVGDYPGALVDFERARALATSPVFDLYAGRALRELKDWLNAEKAFERAVGEADDPGNQPFTEAKTNAKRELEELRAMFPRLTVHAPNLTTRAPDVLLDGEPLTWPIRELPMNPGAHSLTAKLGSESFALAIDAKPNTTLTVPLPFDEARAQAGGALTEGAKSETKSAQKDREKAAHLADTEKGSPQRPLRPWAVGALIGGGVTLASGIVAGVFTLVQSSTLRSWCEKEQNECPNGVPSDPNLAKLQSDALPIASAATPLLVGGGVLSALGVTLFLVDRPRSPNVKSTITLRFHGDGVTCSGTF
jgi:tetratricopeptide (TPR) repeat protein